MSLDERGYKILQVIVDDPAITGAQIEKEMELSRKQISYALEKINYYLLENGYDNIERMRTGKFIVPKDVVDAFKTRQFTGDINDYVCTEPERLLLIALIMLEHKEELSINHFTSTLKISKNTVLSDMRKLQNTMLESYDLEILYNRQKGYYIVGKEYEKRILMVKIIREILEMLNGEAFMYSILHVEQSRLLKLRQDVEEVEAKIHVRYTDERVKEIPYILYFDLLRMKAGKYLDVLPEDYQHIVGTNEYGVVLEVFKKYDIQNTMEKMFLVSQFQISSISSEDNEKFEDALRNAAALVIENFENLICIKFKDAKNLLEALIQHIKPAIYRIRYHYHIESNILNMILPQHSYLHEITRHTIQPLEDFIGHRIPDEELAYITILFGGWLTKEGRLEILEEKRKAIVVCTNGVSISNFLFVNLKELFPEFDFVTTLSRRAFEEYEGYYDVVFTTVHLDTLQPQFLVRPIMNELDLQNIRKKVFSELMNVDTYEIRSSSLLKIIEDYADIHDRKGLSSALRTYLGETPKVEKDNRDKVFMDISLTTLLTPSQIMIKHHSMEWKEAIQLASKPLLESDCITQEYVDRMLQAVETEKPFWVIADGLILAHAGIDAGVKHLGMSMLKLPEKINVNGYMEADIIIVIATPNREIHLKALYSLIDITEDEEDFAALKAADTIEGIVEILLKERT